MTLRLPAVLAEHPQFRLFFFGQTISLDTVRRLAGAIGAAGSLPMAYAAVYAVGKEAWPEWQGEGLYRADGTPWMLGDFLWNVDPSAERWIAHFVEDLRSALDAVEFKGFHLDQYGGTASQVRSTASCPGRLHWKR